MKFIRLWLGRLNLWPQMALAISVGFLMQYVAFSLLGERAMQESSQRILQERLVLARMVANQIDQWLQEEIDELEQANIRAEFDSLDPNLAAEADRLESSYALLDEFSPGFILLNPEGHVVLSRPSMLYASQSDLSQFPHIAAALEMRQATISDPFLHPLNERPVIALTVPMYDGNRFRGLLSGLVGVDRSELLMPLSETESLGDSAHAAVIDSDGRILASTLGFHFLALTGHSSFYRQALAQGEPIVETVPVESSLNNRQQPDYEVVAVAPLRSRNWGVVVGGDINETFAGVQRLRRGLIVLGIFALLAIWGGTLIGARRLLRPIQYLTRSAQRIAQGDLHTSIRMSGANEIGLMANALENMRVQLSNQIEEITYWNKSLEARVDEQTAGLRQEQALTRQLLGQIITAQEEERTRISRELHDELGQILTAIGISLDRLGKSLPARASKSQTRLEQAQLLTDEAVIELRRILTALRPGILDSLGLLPALEWIAKQILVPLGIEVTIQAEGGPQNLSDGVETTIFRVAQEAMNNIARHSDAQKAKLRIACENETLRLVISDDGRGWDRTSSEETPEDMGIGLVSMRERALIVGGHLEVETIPGSGTVIDLTIPLTSSGAG